MSNLVPSLRFPEFSSKWEIVSIGALIDKELIEKPMDGNHGNIHPKASDYMAAGIPFVMSNNIVEGKLCSLGMKYISKNRADKLQKGFAVEGDVLLTHKGTIGATALVEGIDTPYIMLTPQVTYYRVSSPLKLSNRYLLQAFRTPKFQSIMKRLSASGTRPYVGITEQRELITSKPPYDEQQKIADFLTSVDTKIGQLIEKHRLLKEYKKGVIQQIFSQQIRFTDENGNEFPDWKEKSFGSFLTLDLRKVEKPKDNFLALGVRSHAKGIFQKPNFDPSDIAMEELYVVRKDDLVPSITFAWEGAIAIASKQDEGGLVSHRFPTYTFDKQQVIPEFFKYVVPSLRLKYLLGNISPGGAGRNRVLSKKDFIKLTWCVPSVKEQQKISKFLQSIDIKIEGVAEQIEQTKQFKKGLLQQMFV